MKKIGMFAAILLLVSLPFASCKKKEPAPPPQGSQGMSESPHGSMEGGPPKTVSVPDAVKAAWKSVKVEVEFKKEKTKKVFTIPLHSEYKVPGTELLIQVGDFLPQFTMTNTTITSASNDPTNPAVQVQVSEKGTQIFKGWLFAKFPDIHRFQHDQYGLKLVEGEKK